MMTALVSGGDGFIGSNLIKKLLKNEFKIINIDNNITSYPQEFFSEDYTKITEDISHINIDKIEKIDVIIHLASVASPIVYKNNPDLVLYLYYQEFHQRDHWDNDYLIGQYFVVLELKQVRLLRTVDIFLLKSGI